jgi:DNA-binding transcriptional LysR family regulator
MTRDLNVDQIKKLWVLDLIIHSGSLRKAALQAKVSPSAVSQTLSALERSIGKPLLVRNKGEVTPTQEAIAILDVVRPAFAAFERLKDLNHVAAPKMTWLNFGTYESIAVDILPGLIHRLRTSMPNIRLGLKVSRTANLLSMVRKGELCSALITEQDSLERFYAKEVCTDDLGFFVSNKHPIAQLGWKAVHDYGVGSLTPGKEGLPRYFTRFLRQLGGIRPSVQSDSFETLRSAAAAGVLVSVLPHRVAQRQNDLLQIFPDGPLSKEKGTHRILVVSQTNCDTQEVAFLAMETSRILNRPLSF